MPTPPGSASLRQNSSVTAAGSAILWRTNCVLHSLSRNRRAVSRSSSCSSVKPISICGSARHVMIELGRRQRRLDIFERAAFFCFGGSLDQGAHRRPVERGGEADAANPGGFEVG